MNNLIQYCAPDLKVTRLFFPVELQQVVASLLLPFIPLVFTLTREVPSLIHSNIQL